MREYLFLEPGKKNPEAMVEGQKEERAKAERPAEAHQRYLKMLKEEKEKAEREKPPEEKEPKILYADFPVHNPQSPVIQERE